MKLSYLKADPLPLLLEDSDPISRYMAKKYVLNSVDDNDYMNLRNSPVIRKISAANKSGIMGDIKKFDSYYSGSMWHFARSVFLGLDSRDDIIKNTARAICNVSQLGSGGFSLSMKPQREDACITGLMTRYFMESGVEESAVEKAISWIKKNQRHDGGWLYSSSISLSDMLKEMMLNRHGGGLKLESDTAVRSCAFATASCLHSLILHNKMGNNDMEISRAAEFFLENKLFINVSPSPAIWRRFINPDVTRIGLPFFCQYDILYGLLLISLSGRIDDRRTGEAFNILMAKQSDKGTWEVEATSPGMIILNKKFINVQKNIPTIAMLRILNL